MLREGLVRNVRRIYLRCAGLAIVNLDLSRFRCLHGRFIRSRHALVCRHRLVLRNLHGVQQVQSIVRQARGRHG